MSDGDDGLAEVVPIRPIGERLSEEKPPTGLRKSQDTSFEVDLDEVAGTEHTRTLVAKPVTGDAPEREGERRPIIPAYLRTREGIRNTVELHAGRAWHIAAYHTVRLWIYPPVVCWFALLGLFRLVGRQVRWAAHAEDNQLKREAIIDNDPVTYLRLDNVDRDVAPARFGLLALQAAAVASAGAALWWLTPRWTLPTAAVVLVLLLARVGHPDGPIIESAVVKPRYRRLNLDVVRFAYHAAKLGDDNQPVNFPANMHRNHLNTASVVVVDLPHGKTFGDVLNAKGRLASALDVTAYQLFPARDRTSERRHTLVVADRNPLDLPAGSTPLLDCRPRNVWRPCPLGVDEHHGKVHLSLLWNSILIGAQPRKGKTYCGRLIALYCALDPWVKLFIVDGKASPDWRSFVLVAERMIYGTSPSLEHGDPVDDLISLLKHLRGCIDRVNQVLSTLPAEVCPDGKLTEQLARDPRFPDLRVRVVIVEEFQAYFETDDQERNKEIAWLLADIQSRGPSAGIIVISLSQKPSGVGAGDVGRLFNRYRDNHTVRIALRCGNIDVSRAVLGGDAYAEGYDASALPIGDGSDGGPDYRGIGYLYGATDKTPLSRFHRCDKVATEKILRAARAHRDALGLLSGEAAGEVVIEGELVDPIADALAVTHTTEANISWPRLAARLVEEWPNRYDGLTGTALSARMKSLGIKGKSVADSEFFESGRGRGVARRDLELAAQKRAGQG